jgi:exopolysaccharide production protein ExoZ
VKEYLNNLQALRAYAAANVVLVHLLPIFGFPVLFGLCGVDIFFVLSGFLMAMIMLNDPSAFFTRRLIRIVPLYWICTLGVYFIALLKPEFLHTTQANVLDLIKSLCFVPYRKEGGVMQPMLFLGWTLNYEMFFYMICSVVLFFRAVRPVLWVCLIVSAMPALALIFHPASDLIKFYSNPIVLEFVLGMITYLIFIRCQIQPGLFRHGIWLLSFCLVALPCMEVIDGVNHREILLGLPAAGTVFAAARLELKGIAIRSRFILLVGNASYVLYLTHPYVLQIGEKILHCGQWRSVVAKIISGILLAGAAVAFACAFHIFVEVPFVRKLRFLFLPQKSCKVVPEAQTDQVASLRFPESPSSR